MRTAVLDDGAHEEGKKRNAEDGATGINCRWSVRRETEGKRAERETWAACVL